MNWNRARRLLRANWDRTAAAVFFVAGLVALAVGWSGAADKLYPAAQIPYVISGGMLGLFLLGAAGTLWLSADMRDEWRKLDELKTDGTRGRTPPRS